MATKPKNAITEIRLPKKPVDMLEDDTEILSPDPSLPDDAEEVEDDEEEEVEDDDAEYGDEEEEDDYDDYDDEDEEDLEEIEETDTTTDTSTSLPAAPRPPAPLPKSLSQYTGNPLDTDQYLAVTPSSSIDQQDNNFPFAPDQTPEEPRLSAKKQKEKKQARAEQILAHVPDDAACNEWIVKNKLHVMTGTSDVNGNPIVYLLDVAEQVIGTGHSIRVACWAAGLRRQQ